MAVLLTARRRRVGRQAEPLEGVRGVRPRRFEQSNLHQTVIRGRGGAAYNRVMSQNTTQPPRISRRSDAEILARAQREMNMGVFGRIVSRLKNDTGPSFDYAMEQMRQGKPGGIIGKTTLTALGCAIMADGVYNIVSGANENVEDLLVSQQTGVNNTRIFVGAFELLAGAGMAYLALTKGHVAGRD